MKKASLAILILFILTSCAGPTAILYDLSHRKPEEHVSQASLTYRNGGRFTMEVGVHTRQSIPIGQTAVETVYDVDGSEVSAKANYSDGRLWPQGSWSASYKLSDGDDIKVTIPDCPGWEYWRPDFCSITYGNGFFSALGNGDVAWSRDGTSGSWNTSKGIFSPIEDAVEIAFCKDLFLIVFSTGEVNWKIDPTVQYYGGSDVYARQYLLRRIAYGNGRFVAAGGSYAYWSTDLRRGSWSASTLGTDLFDDIAFGNNGFVAVGRSGKATWSPDGTEGSWTESSAASLGLHAIAYGNGRFVAVGQDGTAVWSPDGSPGSWTESKACGEDLLGVAFGNGCFVAVGNGGKIVRSPDGSPGSWTESSTGGSDLSDITYGNGRFMAAGSSGRVMSSLGGSAGSWTEIRLFE